MHLLYDFCFLLTTININNYDKASSAVLIKYLPSAFNQISAWWSMRKKPHCFFESIAEQFRMLFSNSFNDIHMNNINELWILIFIKIFLKKEFRHFTFWLRNQYCLPIFNEIFYRQNSSCQFEKSARSRNKNVITNFVLCFLFFQ